MNADPEDVKEQKEKPAVSNTKRIYIPAGTQYYGVDDYGDEIDEPGASNTLMSGGNHNNKPGEAGEQNKKGKFTCNRRTFELIFSNIPQQIRDKKLDIDPNCKEISTADGFGQLMKDKMEEYGIKHIATHKHYHPHSPKEWHMHMQLVTAKKVRTRTRATFNLLGIEASHLIIKGGTSRTSWGMPKLNVFWYYTFKYFQTVKGICDQMCNKEFVSFIGECGGNTDINDVMKSYIMYWNARKQNELIEERINLQPQKTVSISSLNASGNSNNNSSSSFSFISSMGKTNLPKVSGRAKKAPKPVISLIMSGASREKVIESFPEEYSKNAIALETLIVRVFNGKQYKQRICAEISPLDPEYKALAKNAQQIFDFYVLTVVKKVLVKQYLIMILWGESDAGKTTLIRDGFGAAEKIDLLQLDKAGWAESCVPNNQYGFRIHGFSSKGKEMITISKFEKIGDGTAFTFGRRFLSEQPIWNSNKKALPVALLIDANDPPEKIFTAEELENVMANRISAFQVSRAKNCYAVTNLIRKINQKPPIPAAIRMGPPKKRFDVRLSD